MVHMLHFKKNLLPWQFCQGNNIKKSKIKKISISIDTYIMSWINCEEEICQGCFEYINLDKDIYYLPCNHGFHLQCMYRMHANTNLIYCPECLIVLNKDKSFDKMDNLNFNILCNNSKPTIIFDYVLSEVVPQMNLAIRERITRSIRENYNINCLSSSPSLSSSDTYYEDDDDDYLDMSLSSD